MAYTTIKKPSDYFNTKLYTGTGSATSITGVGFQPDWVWIKKRNGTTSHTVTDSVRGVNKQLFTNEVEAEESYTSVLTAFDSDGFSLSTAGLINASSDTYASWNWLANGAGSANTDGSISSTVSANTTSGFSIVSYTGTGANATVGHGLGSLCKFIIIKRLNSTNDWEIGSTALGWDKHLYFTTGAANTSSNRWQSTAPTNSVFYLGPAAGNNASSSPLIAYCFAEKQGYSKFGSYTGNGNADGTFVYTGFKPAFVMAKSSTSVTEWHMADTARRPNNPNDVYLAASSSAAESTSNGVDFLSNGIKINTSQGGWNQSGATFIYMAFAEEPLVGDNPATAR